MYCKIAILLVLSLSSSAYAHIFFSQEEEKRIEEIKKNVPELKWRNSVIELYKKKMKSETDPGKLIDMEFEIYYNLSAMKQYDKSLVYLENILSDSNASSNQVVMAENMMVMTYRESMEKVSNEKEFRSIHEKTLSKAKEFIQRRKDAKLDNKFLYEEISILSKTMESGGHYFDREGKWIPIGQRVKIKSSGCGDCGSSGGRSPDAVKITK